MLETGAAAPLPLAGDTRERAKAWAWAGRAGAVVLGLVLLVATAAKAVDPHGFAETMQREGLTFGLSPMAAALAALAVEAGLGLALLLAVRTRLVLASACALVAFFVFLNARSWWVAAHGGGEDASCGCFGNLVQRTPAEAFWQDLLMLVPPLLLAFVGRPRAAAAPSRRLVAATAGAAAVALVAWRAPELPLDDLATRLRPGVELAGVCASLADEQEVCLADLVPELREGRWQVVMVDLERAPEQWADALNRYAESGAQPPLLALTGSASEQVGAFTWQWGPSFPLREVPAPLLRPLYRRLPRSFVSEDGRVVSTSPSVPAPPATVAAR
jgi:uncharacterized membrane protein YphA (DoxX/SURF4 family)